MKKGEKNNEKDNGEHWYQATITKYNDAGGKRQREMEEKRERGMRGYKSELVWRLCERKTSISKSKINNNREARAKKVRKR